MAKPTHLGSFVAAAYEHWEARFGTTFAVMLALIQYLVQVLARPQNIPAWVKNFPPYLWLSIGAVMLFWACYAAWREERVGLNESGEKLQAVNARLADRSPHITLEVLSPSGNEWFVYENQVPPPLFYLQHYGGDGARDVRVGPITAPSGKRVLLFEPVNLVNGPVKCLVPFWVGMLEMDSRYTRIDKGQTINQLLYFFLADNPQGLSLIKYEVPLEWQWDEKILQEVCELHYDTKRKHLSVHKPRPL